MIRVFIENEAGSNRKNIFNEQTLEHKKTVEVSRAYPFPYGFVLNTKSGDGDNLDCFVLTSRPLKTGEIVEVEPIGMFEQTEDGKNDPKILAVMPGEVVTVDKDVQTRMSDFVQHVFDHLPGKTVQVGKFLGKDEAAELISEMTR